MLHKRQPQLEGGILPVQQGCLGAAAVGKGRATSSDVTTAAAAGAIAAGISASASAAVR